MHMQKIRGIAETMGIKPGKLNKTHLVREIQRQEGNFQCFAQDVEGTCDQFNCLWMGDCQQAAQKEHRN